MRTTVSVERTNYWVTDNQLEEQTVTVQMSLEIRTMDHRPGEQWLFLGDGPYSMQLTVESMADIVRAGWLAQYGTAPVCVDGKWGGRNYPRLMVPAQQCEWGLRDLGIKIERMDSDRVER